MISLQKPVSILQSSYATHLTLLYIIYGFQKLLVSSEEIEDIYAVILLPMEIVNKGSLWIALLVHSFIK